MQCAAYVEYSYTARVGHRIVLGWGGQRNTRFYAEFISTKAAGQIMKPKHPKAQRIKMNRAATRARPENDSPHRKNSGRS